MTERNEIYLSLETKVIEIDLGKTVVNCLDEDSPMKTLQTVRETLLACVHG